MRGKRSIDVCNRSYAFTAIRQARRDRLARRDAYARQLEQDPDIQRCKLERSRRAIATDPLLDVAKKEFEALIASQKKAGRPKTPPVAPPERPVTDRQRILHKMELDDLARMGNPIQ